MSYCSLILLLVALSLTAVCTSSLTEDWREYEVNCAENSSIKYEFSELPRNWSKISNVSVVLHCETVILTRTLNISNITGLYVKGALYAKGAKRTRIACENSSISVTNVRNLILENIVVEKCGFRSENNFLRNASVSVYSCGNVVIRNVWISNNEAGLKLSYSNGTITIEKSVFQDNHGRGLIISYSNEQLVQITDCKFHNNSAGFGGAVAIFIRGRSSKILIKSSVFSFNKAKSGAGVGIRHEFKWEPATDVTFEQCMFESNEAVEGGGISAQYNIYSFSNVSHLNFKNCVWQGNSQAVNLKNSNPTKQSSFASKFVNCNFTQNGGSTKQTEGNVFHIANSKAKFQGLIIFVNNSKSALKAVSSDLEFEENSVTTFIGNKGKKGGAMRLIGNTAIWLNNNQSFEFIQNTAVEKGGAIFVDSNKFLYPGESPTCFIKLRKMYPKLDVNVTLKGNRNQAVPEDIYAVSLLPCLEDNAIEQPWSKEIISRSKITTAAHAFIRRDIKVHPCPFRLNSTSLSVNQTFISSPKVSMKVHAIPGKKHQLELKLVDEFCNEVLFDIMHTTENSAAKKMFIDNRSIILYGKPHEESKIILTPKQPTNPESPSRAYIKVTMDHCPPGFVLNENEAKCTCGLSSDINQFIGIDCSMSKFRAYVKRGYWVGYYPNKTRIEDTFTSSLCPEGFCQNCSNFFTCKEKKPLPSNRSEDTSPQVCSKNRQGTMCGTCTDGHSVHYHSKLFSCKENKNCHLGWIFYILSEIIPVTILFLVIIFFNISFTSGPLNGVILFMQIINTMKLNAENLIEFDKHIKGLSNIYQIVYQIFTLNFAKDIFTFCLLRRASALDMLAFRYVTIVYSLFLVIATIFLLRLCSLSPRMLSLKRSIIHGLSAFLVMSYSECTRVSLSILTVGTLYTGSRKQSRVVFYNGDYPYMGNEHIKYALPAIFFLVTLVLIPPLILLAYPLCYKVFSSLKIEESKFVRITCKIIPLEKIKPLFDSMQGAFKDQYRFFAGIYFLYRLCSQIPFTFTKTLHSYYLIISAQLAVMLFLHGICRPYKNPWHNFLDGVFFLLLNLINLCSLFNFQLWIFPKANDFAAYFLFSSIVQCTLTFVPLIYLAVYTVYCTALKFKCVRAYIEKRKQKRRDNSDYILYALDTRNEEINDY